MIGHLKVRRVRLNNAISLVTFLSNKNCRAQCSKTRQHPLYKAVCHGKEPHLDTLDKSIPRIKATLDWFQVRYQLCQNTLYKAIWLPFTLMVSLGDSSLLLASHEQDICLRLNAQPNPTKTYSLSLSLCLISDSFQTGSFRLDCQMGGVHTSVTFLFVPLHNTRSIKPRS